MDLGKGLYEAPDILPHWVFEKMSLHGEKYPDLISGLTMDRQQIPRLLTIDEYELKNC